MALIILTKSPKINLFSGEAFKMMLRRLSKKTRGPQAVTSSMLRGLEKTPQEYHLNPSIEQIGPEDIIWVNESVSALKWAIRFKKKNKKIKLIAGPNLVVTPEDYGGIIYNDAIDIILQPSEWTKKFYLSYKPILDSKIMLWPAGVEDPYKNGTPVKENYLILYQKNAPEDIFRFVAKNLDDKGVDYRLIRYGYFDQPEYFSLLDKAKWMIYLSTSESQGLALQEAWIRDVPTLVWDRGFWKKNGEKFEYPKISCPYLTDESGMTFKNKEDFLAKIEVFISNLPHFQARNYTLHNLTDKVTTRKFLDIIRFI